MSATLTPTPPRDAALRPRPASTPTGARPTTCRSARSTCSTTRCCASRSRWSTSSRGCSATGARRPGLNFVYAHLNRVIRARDLNAIYVTGPGHGGPGLVANTYLEGTYSEVYPSITPDEEGMRQLFRQFSFPGGIPSHVAPETPGSIHEGGELGYALVHAYGAAFDNPDLLVVLRRRRRRGRDRAAGRELALQQVPQPRPRRRRAADPAPQRLQDRQPDGARPHPARRAARAARGLRLRAALRRGRRPRGDAPADGRDARRGARRDRARSRPPRAEAGRVERPRWPMIVLRTPKGWTGPARGRRPARRGHVPLPPGAAVPARRRTPSTSPRSRSGCAATGPRSSSTPTGALVAELAALAPARRAPHGRQPARQRRRAAARPASCPTSATTRSTCPSPARTSAEATRVLGDVPARRHPRPTRDDNFRLFGPDETASNRLGAVFEATEPPVDRPRSSPATTTSLPTGRVMEVLSEHLCQGWLEGYLLTGRHGLFNCYEAFIHIVDSMFNQHAKWLKVTRRDPVAPADRVAELPAHLARLAPGPQRLLPPGPGLHRPRRQQEGRGRPRLPAARRQLPAVGRRPLPAQPRLRQRHRRRQAARAALPVRWTRPIAHCTRGIGIWDWASNDDERRARRRHGLRRRRAHAGDARRRRAAARASSPSCACASSTSST